MICRLAPQDYHRWVHFCCHCLIYKRSPLPLVGTGLCLVVHCRVIQLMANIRLSTQSLFAWSAFALILYGNFPLYVQNVDVYTENKRVICPIATEEFGLVLLVGLYLRLAPRPHQW